jgi:hypothetical protein
MGFGQFVSERISPNLIRWRVEISLIAATICSALRAQTRKPGQLFAQLQFTGQTDVRGNSR